VLANFVAGAGYVMKGFRMIRRPGLRRYFVAPIILNILVFAGLTWYGIDRVTALVARYLPESGGWWIGALAFVATVLVGLAFLVLIFFSFTLLLNLIGSPFNDLLAEKVEANLNGESAGPSYGMTGLVRNIATSIKSEVKKYVYFILLGLLVLVTAWIPGVNLLVAPVLSVLVGGWMMALEYLAYPMAVQNQSFPAVRKWAASNFLLSLGFGLTVLLFTVTPLINLLIMPAAVAGATLMWHERREFFGTSGIA